MVNVHCLGNQYIVKDNIALKFLDREINGMKFIAFNENVEGDIVIMDACRGIDSMRILSLEEFIEFHPLSAHDFDIGNEIKILQAIGQVGKVRVIAIPMSYSFEMVLENLKSRKWVEQEMQGS